MRNPPARQTSIMGCLHGIMGNDPFPIEWGRDGDVKSSDPLYIALILECLQWGMPAWNCGYFRFLFGILGILQFSVLRLSVWLLGKDLHKNTPFNKIVKKIEIITFSINRALGPDQFPCGLFVCGHFGFGLSREYIYIFYVYVRKQQYR